MTPAYCLLKLYLICDQTDVARILLYVTSSSKIRKNTIKAKNITIQAMIDKFQFTATSRIFFLSETTH